MPIWPQSAEVEVDYDKNGLDRIFTHLCVQRLLWVMSWQAVSQCSRLSSAAAALLTAAACAASGLAVRPHFGALVRGHRPGPDCSRIACWCSPSWDDGEEGEEEEEASEPGGEAALLEVHQGGGHQPRPVHRLVRSHARNQQRARKSVSFNLDEHCSANT